MEKIVISNDRNLFKELRDLNFSETEIDKILNWTSNLPILERPKNVAVKIYRGYIDIITKPIITKNHIFQINKASGYNKTLINMNAKEARQKAVSFLNNRDEVQFGLIKQQIKDKAVKGEFELFYYNRIHDSVKTLLEKEDYLVVRDSDDRDGSTTYKISW